MLSTLLTYPLTHPINILYTFPSQEKQLLVGQIESMRQEIDQHDHHHLIMTKELQELRLERDGAKAALAEDMEAIRARQQRQEETLQMALRSLADETAEFQKHMTTADTADSASTSATASANTGAGTTSASVNVPSAPVPPFFNGERSSSSAPFDRRHDDPHPATEASGGAIPSFFGSASTPLPNQFKYYPSEQQQQQPPQQPPQQPQQYYEQQPQQQQQQQQQHYRGVEESKGYHAPPSTM